MDKQFFTEEVKAAERSLYRVARSYLPSDHDAADAVQEALLRAWAKRNTIRDERFFRTWLTRVVINVCKDERKRLKRVTPVQEIPEPVPERSAAPRDELKEALRALDAKYRVPLALFYLDGYSIREIAGMMTLPQGTVKNRLHRAKDKLREQLQQQEVFEDET